MSDETKDLTPREVRLCREAYVAGAWDTGRMFARTGDKSCASALAAERYPMPIVEVPRVVVDDVRGSGRTYWRVIDGRIEWTGDPQIAWHPVDTDARGCGMFIHTERVKLLADLLANPTERRPADEVAP